MPFGTEVGLGPEDSVLDGGSFSLPKMGHAPNLRLMSIVAKRSPNSATAELVLDRLLRVDYGVAVLG